MNKLPITKNHKIKFNACRRPSYLKILPAKSKGMVSQEQTALDFVNENEIVSQRSKP